MEERSGGAARNASEPAPSRRAHNPPARASVYYGRRGMRSRGLHRPYRRARNYGLLFPLFLPLFLSIVTNVMANEACPTGTTCSMTGYPVNMCYAATGCSCNAHTYGPLGGPCQACPANSGKPEYYSSGCDCNTGYQGPQNGPCIPCPENSYSAFDYSIGDNYGGKRCLCNTGYSKIEMATNPNWARSCNTNPCSVTASSYTYQEYGGLYADYIPANAVNGVTNDAWYYNEGTVNPWIMIDLGQSRHVEHIRVYSENYAPIDFVIRVGHSSTFSNNPVCATNTVQIVSDSSGKKRKSFFCSMSGRYVSFEKMQQLNEVEIYGPVVNTFSCIVCPANSISSEGSCVCNAGYKRKDVTTMSMPNFARSCTSGACSVTSSGYHSSYYSNDKVVDGFITPTGSNPFIAWHSAGQSLEWVMIDLGQTKNVGIIRFYSSSDAASYGDNYEIRVGVSSIFSNNPVCATNSETIVNVKDIQCARTGRYVSVKRTNPYYMAIAELEIYGPPIIQTSCEAQECATGSTGTAGSCTLCAAGKYKTATGSAACTDCGAGTYSATVGATAASTCQACPANSGHALTSQTVVGSCLCNLGFTGPNGGTCVQCVAGKYKIVTGAAACTDCGVNTYSATVGATAASTCQSCPASSQSTTGSDAATDCQCNAGMCVYV